MNAITRLEPRSQAIAPSDVLRPAMLPYRAISRLRPAVMMCCDANSSGEALQIPITIGGKQALWHSLPPYGEIAAAFDAINLALSDQASPDEIEAITNAVLALDPALRAENRAEYLDALHFALEFEIESQRLSGPILAAALYRFVRENKFMPKLVEIIDYTNRMRALFETMAWRIGWLMDEYSMLETELEAEGIITLSDQEAE